MSLRDLYQEMIVDHGRRPRNFKTLSHATHQHAGHNTLCGDQLMLYVVESNGAIADIGFEGNGCAISMASASLMTEAVKGKTMADVQFLFEKFHELVTQGDNQHADELLGKLAIFAGVAEFPIRVKCATLAWHTLRAALAGETKLVTTE